MQFIMRLRPILARTLMLWMLAAATLVITLLFPLIAAQWEFRFLDGIVSPAEAQAVLDQMIPAQKSVHLWTTASLDVAYPIIYGALFIGASLRFFPQYGHWLALPGLLAIPVDLLEGVVQCLALAGNPDLLVAKVVLTPLKFLLFLVAGLLAVGGLVSWSSRRRA